MILTVTHGAYGFFSPYRQRKYVVESARDLATVFRDTNALFNSDSDPWGLQIADESGAGTLTYMWSAADADDVWQELQ